MGGQGVATIQEIARQMDISLSMAHRHLKTLTSEGIIKKIGTAPKVSYALTEHSSDIASHRKRTTDSYFGPPHVVINLSKIGLRYFRIGINASPASIDTLVRHFSGHPNVGWIFSAEGWFNLAIGLWAKDNAEIDAIGSQIRSVLGKGDTIVFQSETTSLHGFGNRPIHGGNDAMCIIDATTDSTDLSPIETDYIKLIALDSSLSHESLGRMLRIDASEVRMLQDDLIERRVIVGFQDRINYGGYYYKVFIDSLSEKTKGSCESFMQELLEDPSCLYIARANDKYDREFEVVLHDRSDIDAYLSRFAEYKIAILTENLHTNPYPLNKIANFKNISDELERQEGDVIDLRNSKLWYLNYQGAKSYLSIYEDRKYFEAMEKSELDLFDDIAAYVKRIFPHASLSIMDIGSGNGLKGKIFIENIGIKSVKAYYPIDIQPIELEVALSTHADGGYSKHPTLLDIENLSARFPIPVLPNEKQVYLFLGGTYGNFPADRINAFLKPLRNMASLLLITMPIREKGIRTDKDIAESYANIMAENTAFGALDQLGFTKDDFIQNPQYPNLKVHITMEDHRNILSFILKRDVRIDRRMFAKGTVFKMISSWKPTLEEFRAALEEDFSVEKVFHNGHMAIALIGN